MDDRTQGLYGTPMSNPAEARASNMYFLQVKPQNDEGSLEAGAIPLHMLINEQDLQNEQYLISVLQAKQLQLFIDPRGQTSTNMGNSQYYDVPIDPQIISTESHVPNKLNNIVTNQGNLVEHKNVIEYKADTLLPSCNQINNDVKPHSSEFNKKTGQRFVHISDRVVAPRAVAVLPSALQLRRGAVSPRRALPARARFGPVQGITQNLSPDQVESIKHEFINSGLPVFLLKTDDGSDTLIDVSDKDKANWLSLLPLGDQSTANVWVYQEDHELYAVTTRTIPARVPLALGYSKQYAETHKLPATQPALDLDAELTAKHRQWWCYECQRSMSTASLLQRHMDFCHSEEKTRPRRYRCPHCTRTFCRLFTLRRHTARHCTKKLKEDKISCAEQATGMLDSKPDELPDLSINNTTTEDSRLPSDESLQTLTNNLDFSTNLFDTDRMPGLDISGSSRSEDFNYSLGLKDDMGLAGSIDFGIDDDCGKKEASTENTETVFLTCRYCNQAVVRGRQRQHVRACTGRKFHCECGRVFQYKDKLALHIHLDHAGSRQDGRQLTGPKESDGLQYRCETCNHNFKRRGMLVNHLWRVHKNVSAAVPLEKRVRHYPCGACAKVYRTAAKRDRHVRTHHPGSELIGLGAIEGGRQACAPAACAACPRQYATRAKLLQHVRKDHPALAPPVKKKYPCNNQNYNKSEFHKCTKLLPE